MKKRERGPHSPWQCPFCTGFSMVAQSAGVKMIATSTESAIAATMVTENWR